MTDVQPILKARGLMKRYGTVVAINGSDFDLMPGEILAVIGDNGAGKSTLIKALSGAVTPDHGTIELDGKPVNFRSRMMRATRASRRSIRTWPCRPRCRLRTTCSLAASGASRASWGRSSARWIARGWRPLHGRNCPSLA